MIYIMLHISTSYLFNFNDFLLFNIILLVFLFLVHFYHHVISYLDFDLIFYGITLYFVIYVGSFCLIVLFSVLVFSKKGLGEESFG